jgi:hypothetical protein
MRGQQERTAPQDLLEVCPSSSGRDAAPVPGVQRRPDPGHAVESGDQRLEA